MASSADGTPGATTSFELGSLCGDEQFVAERVAAYKAATVTTLSVTPVGGEFGRDAPQAARDHRLGKISRSHGAIWYVTAGSCFVDLASRRGPTVATTEEVHMPKYLLEVNYTLQGVKALVEKGGSARKAAAQAAAKSVGGKVESFYFAFGGTDAYVVIDAPDNQAAAALALAVSAGGGATAKTVVLLTPEDVDGASNQTVKYSPPGN